MELSVLFTAGIFFISFLALLLAGFNAMLSLIKKDIAGLETGQVRFDKELKELKAGQANLEKRMDGIENKLDQLIARSN